MSDKNRANSSNNVTSEAIDIGRIIGELIDNRWLIIGVTASFLTLGVLYSLFSTPIYRADAIVQVEQNVGNSLLSNISQILPNSQPEAAPEIEILKSRMILSKTVKDLDLTTVVEQKFFPIFGKGLHRLTGEKTESISIDKFNISQVPVDSDDEPYVILKVLDNSNFEITKDDGSTIEGTVGRFLKDKEFSILVSNIDADVGSKFKILKRSELKSINLLLENFEVADKGKDTGVLGLTLTGDNPVMIQRILDNISKNYLEQNIERKSEEDARSLGFLKEQLPLVRNSLDLSESKLNQYRQKNDSVDLSLEAKSVLDSIVSVDTQLNELTFKEAEISKLYTKEHPSYRALLEKRKTLEEEREKFNKRVSAMPKTQQEILRLSRDVQSGQEIYMQLLSKEQELSISKASTIGNVRIIDPAVTQTKPVQPKKIIVLIFSIILGGIVSIGYTLLRSILHKGIERPEQLEELGISVYASVPLSEWQRKKDLDFSSKNKGKKVNADANVLLAFGNPTDLAIEAIRSLRTSLHFAMMEATNNVLMISGASPGIGKTFISANLAAVVAQAGQRVLFIDSDMRKGYAHELMGLDSKNGLSEVLSGRNNVSESVQTTTHVGLDFLARGQIPPNPSELLMHNRFGEILSWASSNYDLVLVDTPPILAVTDAAIIGKKAGTSLMVARFELNSPKEVEMSVKRFEQNGVEIKGVILNAVIKRASNYYNYGYDYYDYSYNNDKK